MKKIFFLILLFVFAFSCSKSNDMTKNENQKKSENKTDTKKYNKIVILDPAVVEMVYLLESEDKIAGVANLERSKIWPEEKVAKLPSVGTFMKPSLEKIIALKPDLVVASFHTTEELDNGLKSNNIDVKRFNAKTVEDIFKNFEEVAKLVEKEEEAKKIIAEKRAKLDEIKKLETTEKKGLFVSSTSPLMAFGKDTLPTDIMKLLNIKNIAETLEGASPTVTPEYIIKENPEIIVTMVKNPNEIVVANPQIKDIDAIKNNKFIIVDSSQILRGSPRTIDHIIEVYEKTKK